MSFRLCDQHGSPVAENPAEDPEFGQICLITKHAPVALPSVATTWPVDRRLSVLERTFNEREAPLGGNKLSNAPKGSLPTGDRQP